MTARRQVEVTFAIFPLRARTADDDALRRFISDNTLPGFPA